MEGNMNRQRIAWIAGIGLSLALAAPAAAQNAFPYFNPGTNPYQQQRPPVLSPYLNLINRGNPAVNYYNFVQPQLQLAQPFAGYQGPPPTTGYQPGEEVGLDPHDPTSVMPRSSGHPTTFNSTGTYFNSLGTIGSAFGRPGGAAPTQLPATGRRR
jgi:hypothetical protein